MNGRILRSMREETESMSEEDETFEALINGSEIDTIDPVLKITISNAANDYEYEPSEIQTLVIRKMRKRG